MSFLYILFLGWQLLDKAALPYPSKKTSLLCRIVKSMRFEPLQDWLTLDSCIQKQVQQLTTLSTSTLRQFLLSLYSCHKILIINYAHTWNIFFYFDQILIRYLHFLFARWYHAGDNGIWNPYLASLQRLHPNVCGQQWFLNYSTSVDHGSALPRCAPRS